MAALAYVALVALGATAAGPRAWAPRGRAAAVALWLVVAVPSLVQLARPRLLDRFERDPDRIAAGQLWRLATSAVTQDGGLTGTTFNLVVLAVTVATTTRLLGGRGLWVAFWAGAVAGNLLVLAIWPSVGAGNSVATFTVAVTAVTVALRRDRSVAAVAREVAVLALGGLLLAARDLHGFAVVTGTVLGLVWPARAER